MLLQDLGVLQGEANKGIFERIKAKAVDSPNLAKSHYRYNPIPFEFQPTVRAH